MIQFCYMLQDSKLAIIMVDDFHVIHTIKQPTTKKLSNAGHFSSCLVNTPGAPGVARLATNMMHQCITQRTDQGEITIIGGICAETIEEIMITTLSEQTCSPFEQLPSNLTDISADGWNKHIKSLAVYDVPDHPVQSTSLSTCGLVDQFVTKLKNIDDYDKVFQEMLRNTPMNDYLKKYAAPFVADWPGWYYTKRLVAHSRIPPSIIPHQGPFHVYLNIIEDHVQLARFFYAPLFKFIFGKELPPKPKLFRCEIILAAAFLGWKKVRHQVIRKFKRCKDIEYTCLLHNLEEVLPLVTLHYPAIFKSGSMEVYRATMRRLSLLFMTWKWHHYDKSTLSWLSDDTFHQKHFKEYDRRISIWNMLVTDLIPEIWHAKLRRNVESHFDEDTVRQRALTLAAMVQAGEEFQHFLAANPLVRHCPRRTSAS